VPTNWLLLMCVATSKTHWQLPEAGELRTYFEALGEGGDCGGGWEVDWSRLRDWWHWNADQTEVIQGSETLAGTRCEDERCCH
jgi:hypothetical protein